MKGLLYKEFFIMQSFRKSFLLLVLLVGFYTWIFKNPGMIYIIASIYSINGTLTSFTCDSMYQWDINILGMPVDRRQVVWSKYVFAFFLLFSMTALTTAAIFFCYAAGLLESLGEMLLVGGAILILLLFYTALAIPLVYRLGVERARMVSMVLALSPLICLVIPWGSVPLEITPRMVAEAEGIFFLAALAANAVSVWCSVRFYGRKEF